MSNRAKVRGENEALDRSHTLWYKAFNIPHIRTEYTTLHISLDQKTVLYSFPQFPLPIPFPNLFPQTFSFFSTLTLQLYHFFLIHRFYASVNIFNSMKLHFLPAIIRNDTGCLQWWVYDSFENEAWEWFESVGMISYLGYLLYFASDSSLEAWFECFPQSFCIQW